MGRPPRPVGGGITYHAMARGNDRRWIFASDDDRHDFLDRLDGIGQSVVRSRSGNPRIGPERQHHAAFIGLDDVKARQSPKADGNSTDGEDGSGFDGATGSTKHVAKLTLQRARLGELLSISVPIKFLSTAAKS